MTNIHDIARLSGYSVSTVSRVLNHQNYVSAKTRGDIEAVINKLDYVPNAVARNLSRGATLTIGVVLPHVDHPYFTQLLHGIMRAAFAANYHIVLLPSKWDSQLELKYLEALRQHAYDALIFTSHGLPLKNLQFISVTDESYCVKIPMTILYQLPMPSVQRRMLRRLRI